MKGFVKVFRVDVESGKPELIHEQDNTIVYQGSDILAKLLAGTPDWDISHMYLTFRNGAEVVPAIDKTQNRGTYYSLPVGLDFVRVPLVQAPTFLAEEPAGHSYEHNVAVFTSLVNSTTPPELGNLALADGTSQFLDAALVSATSPTSNAGDKVFSRIVFNPEIDYSSTFHLTVVWGVKFVS